MHNAEVKARQFIERQRKRTATLGAQRHHRHIYKVDRTHLETNNSQIASNDSGSPEPQNFGKNELLND